MNERNQDVDETILQQDGLNERDENPLLKICDALVSGVKYLSARIEEVSSNGQLCDTPICHTATQVRVLREK